MQGKAPKRKTRGKERGRGSGAECIPARRAEERTERSMPSSDDSKSVSIMTASMFVKEMARP